MILTGDKKIKLFAGITPVKAAYVGSEKVYPNSSLAVTGALAFAAAGGGQSLSVTVEEGRAWTLSGVPTGWTASAMSGSGPATITISAPNNTSTVARNGLLTVASDGLTASCSLSQTAGIQVYAVPSVWLTVADIPASGGTVAAGTVGYSQTWTWNGVAGSGGILTSGGAVSYSAAVSAGGLGTTIRSRTAVGTLTATVAMNGRSSSASATVYQGANAATTISYGTPIVSLSYPDIAAGGSTVTPTVGYSQSRTQYYTSGATTALAALTSGGALTYSGTAVNTSTGAVTAASLVTTVKPRTKITTATVTVSMNGLSGVAAAEIYQAENRIESGTDDDLLNKRAVAKMVITAQPGSITANGGSTTFKAQLQSVCTYTSGAQSIRYDTAGILARSSSGSFSVSSPGTLEADGRTFSFTVSASQNSSTSSRSTTITVYGAAAYATDTKTTVSVSQTGQPNTATIRFTDLSGNTISEIECASDGLLLAQVPLAAAAVPSAYKPIGNTQFAFRVVPSNSAMEWMMDAGNGTYFANNCGGFSCTTDGTICYPTLAAGGTLRFTGERQFSGTFTGSAGASFAFYVRYTSASGNAMLTIKGT